MNTNYFKYKKIFFFLSLSVFNFSSLHVQAADLFDVYNMARGSDPQYKQIEAANRATLEQKPQAMSQLLPSLQLSANTVSNDQDISSGPSSFGRGGDVSFNSHGYSLNLSQPVFRWDRWLGLKQADSRIEQANAELSVALQDLMIRVAESYFNVLSADDSLTFARAELKSLSRQLDQARQRFEVGLTAITDVQEAQAGYDRAVAQEIAAENNVDNAREGMREITGEYLTVFAGLTTEPPLVNPQPDDIDEWTNIALEQNLEVMATRAAVDTARQEVKRQTAGHLPTLDLLASQNYNKSGGRFGDNKIHSTTVGLELNIPLFQGGLVSSRRREAQQRLQEQLERLEQVRRSAHRSTREAYLGVISGISQVKALKQVVISSETALQATLAGFEVGTRTAVDVVAAERVTSQAKRDYARSKYDYLIDTLRLKRAAGTLSDEDMQLVNQWLN